MVEENSIDHQNDNPDSNNVIVPPAPEQKEVKEEPLDTTSAEKNIQDTLLSSVLGFVNFDGGISDNTTSGAMVSAERRKLFRRDVYVGIKDAEQNLEFLGRIVQGPFHTPHEIGSDSAITRTTVLHPERTKFRPSYYVFGDIEILGQLMSGERVIPTPTRPRPYSEIYIFPPERLRKLLEIEGNVLIGHLMGYDDQKIEVRADAGNKNFLPRNVGIFGTVGSGKSNTVQVLVEEALSDGWAVVAIDVEGEYVRMNEPTDRDDMKTLLEDRFKLNPKGVSDFKVYVPSSGESDASTPVRFKVPIEQLDNNVVYDIQEFSEPQQRMFERVITFTVNNNQQGRATRLGNISSTKQVNKPYIDDINAVKSKYPKEKDLQEDLDILISKYSKPNSGFAYTLQNLIDNLQDNNFLSSVQPFEKNTASALRSKLISIGRSGMLDWNANNQIPYLPINELLVGGRLSVLDVSETDDRSRNIAIAYILQSLFEKVIETPVNETIPNTTTLRPKVLVVIEEVHTFVSRQSVNKMRAVLDNLQTISRRGRKRWMSLALISQQPGHVPDELFELANTRFIHQLKSATNLAPVKQTTGGVHEALWSTIPALGPGQCLLTGSTFKNPIFVNIRPAQSRRLLTG